MNKWLDNNRVANSKKQERPRCKRGRVGDVPIFREQK